MLKPLIIDGTKNSPEVILDPHQNIYRFSGTSMSEDAVGFYLPVIKWIKEYAENPNEKTHVVFKMTYFNTASSKLLWEIMILFQNMYIKGHKIKIEWQYSEEDEDMEEAGEIYAERMDIPIDLIMIEN